MTIFQFKFFSIQQANSTLKVGTDAMILGASIEDDSYRTILDIGTGTGVLALMSKQKNSQAKITAIDIDEQSLIDCKNNFKNSMWSNDLTYSLQDISTFTPKQKFDCIICNPPFYENGLLSESDYTNRAKHVTDFSFSLEKLFIKAKELLAENGHFWIILPYLSADKWVKYGDSIKLFTIRKQIIFGKPNIPKRMILTLGLHQVMVKENYLTIRNNDNSYTEEYKRLTKDFHNRKL